MSEPHPLPDGRLIARATVSPKGWEPWALSAAMASGLRDLLQHDPEGFAFLRASIKVDNPTKRYRGDRLHISVVWGPEPDDVNGNK